MSAWLKDLLAKSALDDITSPLRNIGPLAPDDLMSGKQYHEKRIEVDGQTISFPFLWTGAGTLSGTMKDIGGLEVGVYTPGHLMDVLGIFSIDDFLIKRGVSVSF